jgi:hypothetical protein
LAAGLAAWPQAKVDNDNVIAAIPKFFKWFMCLS